MDFMRDKKAIIGIVSMGKVPEIMPKVVAANIQGYLNLPTDILSPLDRPDYAFDERRLQYNAAEILKTFESMNFGDYEKVIGILEVDLFLPIFTYVFGEAKLGGKRAIVSLYRLQKGSPAPSPPVHERAAKVALHELGHLFNLSHCGDGQCLMHFSGELQDLDGVPFLFCRYCNTFLKDALSLRK